MIPEQTPDGGRGVCDHSQLLPCPGTLGRHVTLGSCCVLVPPSCARGSGEAHRVLGATLTLLPCGFPTCARTTRIPLLDLFLEALEHASPYGIGRLVG